MTTPPPIFIRRVALKNYMSIARCDLSLGPLTFLLGQNGVGKSNFLDALRMTSDSLNTSLEHALRERGGIGEVRRRSSGHPTNFGIKLEWSLPTGDSGSFAFQIGALPQGAFEVQREVCRVNFSDPLATPAFYDVRAGKVHECSLAAPPAASADRLFLVAASGQSEFRPIYDSLLRMGFYNFNPDVIRELQSPDPGEVLDSDGRNLASVLKRLAEPANKQRRARLVQLLGRVVPGIVDIDHKSLGKKETMEFRQVVGTNLSPWSFDAENMSDGTLRALGVLVALFQPPASDGRAVRLVGIEEPETALHPGASAVLRSALFQASAHTQVIVTSHSPDLLDDKEIVAESLVAVTNQGGATLLGPVDEASRSSIRDHLFTAGELLRLNQLGADETAAKKISEKQLDLFESS